MFYLILVLNRRLNEVQVRDGNIILNWKSVDNALYTLVTHKFSKGEEKTIKVPDTEYETVIKYYFSGGNIFRFTVYKPSEIALDELYSTSNGMFFLQLIDL